MGVFFLLNLQWSHCSLLLLWPYVFPDRPWELLRQWQFIVVFEVPRIVVGMSWALNKWMNGDWKLLVTTPFVVHPSTLPPCWPLSLPKGPGSIPPLVLQDTMEHPVVPGLLPIPPDIQTQLLCLGHLTTQGGFKAMGWGVGARNDGQGEGSRR